MLTKKSMDELALGSVMDALFLSRNKIDVAKISDLAQRKLLIDTTERYVEHQKGREKCEPCKENLKENGCVCSAHYHDYAACHEDWCLPCFLLRSARAAYPDDQKWQE